MINLFYFCFYKYLTDSFVLLINHQVNVSFGKEQKPASGVSHGPRNKNGTGQHGKMTGKNGQPTGSPINQNNQNRGKRAPEGVASEDKLTANRSKFARVSHSSKDFHSRSKNRKETDKVKNTKKPKKNEALATPTTV